MKILTLPILFGNQGYNPEQINFYKWNSHSVNKHYGDYSLSLGLVWTPSDKHLVKVNIGRSFRLPGANELAANGVHHGTFRHEQGDAKPKVRTRLATGRFLSSEVPGNFFLRLSICQLVQQLHLSASYRRVVCIASCRTNLSLYRSRSAICRN